MDWLNLLQLPRPTIESDASATGSDFESGLLKEHPLYKRRFGDKKMRDAGGGQRDFARVSAKTSSDVSAVGSDGGS